MKRILGVAIATAFSVLAAPADAVVLNPHGTGQVLIYPYYTVNHQQTLVSVINTTGHGKALKVRFREGYDGRDVANFNVYLGPYDSWVGATFDSSADGSGAAAIATNDNSCTVPAFPLVQGSGTLHALTFSNANYSQGDYGTPTGTDSGPTNLARTREGFFEIIEMGEVADQASGSPKTLEAITPVNGTPPGCSQVRDAWANGGYWTTNATTDLLPPGGGVYGAAGIVDVAQGTLYAYDATAIDNFSDVAQHTGPGNAKPNLATAVTDSARGIASAFIPVGNTMVEADYPVARAVDAVSAVLTVETLANDFDIDPTVGAQTDFLVTFPTKHFYADPGIVGTSSGGIAFPFLGTFGGGFVNGALATPGCGYNQYTQTTYDREGVLASSSGGGSEPPPLFVGPYFCFETEVVTVNAPVQGPSKVLGSALRGYDVDAHSIHPTVNNGNFTIDFYDNLLSGPVDAQLHSPFQLRGLPAVGFAAINYINANVTPGVLSNYSGTYPFRPKVTCVAPSGQACAGAGAISNAVTFSLNPAPAPLAIYPNPINAGTGTGSSATVAYSALYASSCSVSSSAGTPTPSGSGNCPAVSLANTACSGIGSPLNCSASGAVTESTALAGPSSCNYSLTATCNPGGVSSSATLTVVSSGGGGVGIPPSCQNLASIGTGIPGQYWSQVVTTKVKFGDGATASNVDATSYVAVWDYPGTNVPWPGSSGLTTRPTAAVYQYFSEQFVVPRDGSVTGHPNWALSGSGINANASMTISTCPGDFGQTGTHLTGATGCKVDMSSSSSGLTAFVSASQAGSYCALAPGGTYYFNILPMANLPINDVSTTSCNGTCTPWLGVFR